MEVNVNQPKDIYYIYVYSLEKYIKEKNKYLESNLIKVIGKLLLGNCDSFELKSLYKAAEVSVQC